MTRILLNVTLFFSLVFGIYHPLIAQSKRITPSAQSIDENTMSLYDQTRRRFIPVETYVKHHLNNQAHTITNKVPVAIINHGYTAKNTEYSFLAKKLADKGYFVISIQHELPTDPPLAKTGNLYQRRKPVWENGIKNIRFVIHNLSKKRRDLDLSKVILIGHSNGGDIIMLFATQYPQSVKALIDLDSLRMPFPRTGKIPILTIRANDTKADEGVLPPKDELKQDNIKLVDMKKAKHIDLCDRGSALIKEKINQIVMSFIKSIH